MGNSDSLALARQATDYQKLEFEYRRSADQDAPDPVMRPVVVIGAGPVGLALAVDLAQRAVPVVLLDNDNTLSTGSRAICFAKRTLEIFDRLGCGDRMVEKGVSWSVGRVFFRDEQLFRFDLQPEAGYHRPAFINLQQYYVEGFLADRARELPAIDMRWKNQVTGIERLADFVRLTINTPEGDYLLDARYVAACDGARSAARQLLGHETKGRIFRDRFLIADIRIKEEMPAERWFWFDPAFHPNQSVLLHRQPDGVWRIDFQLGWDADPNEEKRPEKIIARVKALLAHSTMGESEFELEWASVYTFGCLRMDSFRHGRVLFAGDAAHGVSPFGARGANSGIQDAENLAWKLAAVLKGHAPEEILSTYAAEREYAADENILNSTRSTDFITPKSEVSRLFRDAVLELAKTYAFARALVNSGRLSLPATLCESPLNTPDTEAFAGVMVPGAAAADAPLLRHDGKASWLLAELGAEFTLLIAAPVAQDFLEQKSALTLPEGVALKLVCVTRAKPLTADELGDEQGLLMRRYDLSPGSAYLFRPDQHVCARWRNPDAKSVAAALRHALALD